MPDKVKLKVVGDEATIEEGADSLLGKLIAGTHGKIKLKTPFGEREIKKIKDHKGKKVK